MSSIENINNELALLGIDAIKTIDPCPERTAYIRHLAEAQWDDGDWKKTLKALKLGSLLAYQRYISSLHPNLIYELGEDKTFWNYDFEEGVYIEMSFAEVRGIVISLLIADNMSEVATEGTAKNILNRYRAQNLHRGVRLDSFADPEGWIHVNNGWLRLETSTLEPHSPEKRSLYKTVVDFNPEATCPLYDAYMDVDTKMPKDQTRVLDQYSGYILTTRIDQQKMLILEGGRGCGKSMLPEIWLEILGQKAMIASLTSLTSGEIRFMGESFAHKNFCFFDEANPKTNNINEYFQNMVTKPYITIERKAIQKKVNVKNTLKMVLCLNEMPDHMPTGMSRRYRHIVFTHSFTDEAGDDTNYKNKIVTNELSGVLNRMLAGLKDINKMGGMTMMAGEAERIREHSLVSDDLSAFLEDHFEPSLDSIVRYSYSQVQNAFLAEYEQKGYYKQLSVRGFNKKLLANRLPEFRRIVLAKTAGVRGYKGMKLKDGHRFDNNEKSTIKVLGMPDPDYF